LQIFHQEVNAVRKGKEAKRERETPPRGGKRKESGSSGSL